LPYANVNEIQINGTKLDASGIVGVQVETHIELISGDWEIFYVPTKSYI
jgi:uncharacterized protein (UPF0276 family)